MADETWSASSAFSPLSGGYLLIVLSEPHSEQHKQVLLEHLAKGLASWDSVGTQIDIESELRNIATQCPNGEEVRNGEKLIQLASDSLVTEILIQPQLSTLKQCMRNLLASFTRHRHVIHAGYTLSGPGSWILQDGTYDFGDFLHIVQEPEIQRLYRAYESSITMDLHCADEGQWSAEKINQDPAIKAAKISVNPPGRLSATESQSQQDAVNAFVRYISDILPSVTLDHLLEPSDVVGNIRFNHPTLYVFPGGQGDSALFGISGFNILVDGGFGRKPCFWDFTRHLDRLDAVVMTRSNASSLSGLTGAICRKASSPVYPQMGHIFCNLPRDGQVDLADIDQQSHAADSTSESLTVNINDLCRAMSAGLGALQLKAQPIYRSATLEPINLYHKVGHGTLDMFIVSPSANSPEVKELMRLWRSGDVSTAFKTIKMGGKEFRIPLLDIVSVCALLVWQPADPNEAVTRLLFPGSAPQHKILEGLEKFRQLEFLKSPVFMAKDVAAPPSAVITPSSTSSAFTKSPVKTSKSASSPRHTPIEPVPVKAAAARKEVSSSKPPPRAADHSGSNANSKETDAKPRPAPKVIKADVLSSSSRTGSAELRAKKAEAKPTTAAPIKSATAKKETAVNGETNKTLAPKIKKDVANMKMVEARVHSFKSPASLKRAEESTKNKKPADDKDVKDKVQRSQSQSREKRSASSVRGQPADEEKTRVKLVKKIAPSTTEATPVSPAKTATKPIKAKPKETSKPAEPKAPVAKEPLKKDKPAAAKPKPAAAKDAPKPAPKAPASSSSTPSGKAVKRPVKAAAMGAAATVVAVAALTSEQQPTEEQPAVVEEDFNATEAPQAASSPKHDAPTDGGQVPDETSIMEAIESQILEDVEAVEQQSQHESEPDPANAEDEVEEKEEEQAEGSVAGEVADAEEAEESAEKDEEELMEAEEEQVAQLEDEGAGSEELEAADAVISEEVVQTEDAEADAETDGAEVVVEEVAEEVTEEVKEKTDDEEETGPEIVEPEESDEKSANDKEPEEAADVEENERRDDVVDVQDEEMANEAQGRSIDNEVALDVAQVDQGSNDRDDNLETDECPEPVEEEIQPAVWSTSVDAAGRPKSASPQPVASGDEMANVSEDDIIDQMEQSHHLDATQQERQKETVEELEASSEENDVEDENVDENTTSPEPVEEDIRPAVSSQSVETSKPLPISPQPHEERQEDDIEDVDRENKMEEEAHQEESSLEPQTIDKELDEGKDNYEHPVAIACQLSAPAAEEIQPEESENVVSGQVDDEEEEIDDHRDIEKRQSRELTLEGTGHQEDALSSLSSLSDLEPTPVLDRSGASLYEEEQQLSSMESQPESHQFTQKSAPQMSSPKDAQQSTKWSLAVAEDESSGPSSVEVEEEFKAEIVVRPVPISVPLGVVDFVAPHQPAPSPPVVKSPIKDVPTPLVLDEEDDGVEVEEEAFLQEIKTKDSAVPITPVEEDRGASSFSYDEPQRQSEDRQLPSSQFSSDEKEDSTVDGTALSRSKEAEADAFRAAIDNQYAGFMKAPEEKSKVKTPEEKPWTETTVEKKQPERVAGTAVEQKTEEKTSSPLEAKCAAVEEKKSEGAAAKKTEVKPAEQEEEEVEEEIVSKAVDNKSVKAENVQGSSFKDVAKWPESKPLDDSEILEMIAGDIVTEKVAVSTTGDKSVKVSVDLEAQVVKTSEHIVESFQAAESTKSTKETESFVERAKSFVEDVKSSLVEDVQVSKMDIKPVGSEEKVLSEESKEVFKKGELSMAVHSHPTQDIEKKDEKDSVPDVPIQTTDTKSVKVDEVEVAQVSGKEKGFIEEVIQKICSVELVEKAGLTKELPGKAAEEEEESVPVFEKCDKYGKTEKDDLSAIVEPFQQSTSETVVLSAEVKSQRSSTSEAAPMELEFDIAERKLSDVSSSSSAEKDVIVEAVASEIKATTIESGIKSAASEPDIVDPVFVAPVTASSPIDGPELLKELTFPQGLPSKSDSSLNSQVDEIKETIQDVKVSLTELTSKPETDTLSKDKIVEEVKQILADVKETFKLESDHSSKSQVEEIKEIIHADVKATLESETFCRSEVEEVKETVPDVRKASFEMAFDADLPKPKVEEAKEIISDVRKSSVEMTFDADLPKSKVEEIKEMISNVRKTSVEMAIDSDLTQPKVEEVKEIITDARKASVEMTFDVNLPKPKVEEVKEMIFDVKKPCVETAFDADLPKSEVEEVKEMITDVKKASVEMASKSEADLHKPQVEEIKEIIKDVKEAVQLLPKSESTMENQVQQVKEIAFELPTKPETEFSCKSKSEEAKEIIQDVKKTEELAVKCESVLQETQVQHVKETPSVADCDARSGLSSKGEEVRETIEAVKKAASDLFATKQETGYHVEEVRASKVAEIAEPLSKLEVKMEVKAVTPEPEVIPQATFQLKCDPLANLPVVELVETSNKNVVEEMKPKSSDLAKLEVVDKTEQLKPETIDCSNVSCSSSASVTPKTPLSPNIARREVAVESTANSAAANLESFAAPPPTRFEDDVRDVSQPSSLDSMEVHSNSSTCWAGAEKQHEEEEDEEVAATSLTPTINYLAAGYEGVNISTASKLSTIASSDGETDGAQPPSLDSNWSSKTFDKLTLAAESGARHQPEESAFSSGPSSWDDREPGARPYYVVSESISDRSATSSIISHATDDDYPAEKLDRPSLVSHGEPRSASGEPNFKKELDVAPVSPVPSSPFSTDRCSSHDDFEANKDSLSSIQTSESSDYHLETKVDDSASAISSTRSDYSDDRSGSSVDPTLLQQQRLEQRSLTPRSDISCSSETTEPVTTANTTQLIQPGQQQTPVELKASSKAELADPKLAPHNIWLKEKDTASSPNPFTDQYADDDTDHSEPLASSTLYYQQQQQQPPVQHHLSDFESDRHSDSQSSSVPVAEYTDEYYAQHLDYVETSQKSSHPHPDEVSDQEAYLYESEHDDQDHHYHPYATKYSDSYDEADLYPTEEAINDDYRHIGDHQNGNSYHYYESSESATTDDVVGNLHGQYEDLNRNDRTPTRDAQHPYVAPNVYETEPTVISPTSRQLDVTTAATTSTSRDERALPQTSPLPSPQPQQLSPQQQQQQQHEETLASWGKPLGLPAPVAPGVVFSSNGSNGSPLKRPATATNNGHKVSDKATNGANNAASAPFYVDLAYIPHHSDPRYSDVDFFKRIRARHYVLSTLEPSAQVLDALLEGKQSWTGDDKDLDVTIIPTYDSDALATWVSANEDVLARNRIDLAPSASRCTINLQDHETSCSAYRLEF